ncbi:MULTISPECIES: NB-ARC domain-containing protein [unclassified Microcoleus]|uniref:NB-ARC domain-containing protein n=1 Tax=unclassified Microcoleus TaxID=2642155 RepID=UPI002FCEADD0
MSDRLSPEQVLQSILQNVQVGGNLTTGDINQILNLLVIVKQPDSFKQTGIPHNIPSSGTIKFVGRSEELEHLHQMLRQNNQVVIAAIEGMGGVGKTELATQYALLHLLLLTYPGGICWLRARDEDIGLQVVRFAQTELGLKPPENLDLPEQVRWCWRRWRDGDVLIVLDDVNDYPKVEPYMPPQPSQFKVLITTRLQLNDLVTPLTLDVFDEVAALQLLREWVGAEQISCNLETRMNIASELCERLGYLPLALNLVGRYVRKCNISLTEMLKRLEEKGLKHQALEVDKNDRRSILKINRGVTASFELSWEELSENAKKLGFLVSLFASTPIPWSLVKSSFRGLDDESLINTIVELESLHLLKGKEVYNMHPLIREFIRSKLKKYLPEKIYHTKVELKVKKKSVNFVLEIPINVTYKFLRIDKSFLWNLAQKFHKNIPVWGKKFSIRGQIYSTKLDFVEAMTLIAKQIPQMPNYDQVLTYSPAIPHLEEVANNLSHYIQDKDLVKYFEGLAGFYHGQYLFDQSSKWCFRCLEISLFRFRKPSHLCVAQALNNLAINWGYQGNTTMAKTLIIVALKGHKDAHRIAHLDVAACYHNFAYLLRTSEELHENSAQLNQAHDLYQKALDIWITCMGENHEYVATCLTNIADIYIVNTLYTESEEYLKKAFKIWQSIKAYQHPNMIETISSLASLYTETKQYYKAEILHFATLKLHQKLLGIVHIRVLIDIIILIKFYCKQCHYQEARIFYLEALVISKQLGLNESDLLVFLGEDIDNIGLNELEFEPIEIRKKMNTILIVLSLNGQPKLESTLDNLSIQAILDQLEVSL